MIKESKGNLLILEAYEKGYRVCSEGKVTGVRGSILTLGKNTKGYYRFQIRYRGKSKGVMVHRLQAYQKFGVEALKPNVVVRHKNGIETDNSYDNILIGSQSENMLDKGSLQLKLDASHPTYNHKLIIEDKKAGLTHKEIMVKYGIKSKSTVSHIINKSLESQGLK